MGQCGEVADGGEHPAWDPPALGEKIRAPQARRFSARTSRQFSSRAVEPFSQVPDKALPGTLLHSGNRPAPPSDHTPLARRSAFWRTDRRSLPAKFRRACGVEAFREGAFAPGRLAAGICQPTGSRNLAVPAFVMRGDVGAFQSTLGNRRPPLLCQRSIGCISSVI
jgi:hypothetical protein